MNDILLESQKMIYAPPSREKSKQTVRSPMIEKGPIAATHGSAIGVNGGESEYLMAGSQYGVVVSG